MSDNESSNQTKAPKFGKLYVVSTPIGNNDDITIRGLKVLRESDVVVTEEPKEGARILKQYNISAKMECLNEQNEFSKTEELLELLKNGKHLALISDCGTPLFADPGYQLVKSSINLGINVVVVPGPSSIMTALVRSTFNINQFLYAGFLSRDKELRLLQLSRLKEEYRTVVILETPYRLLPLLEATKEVMPDRKAYIGCNLTMPYESHHYGTFKSLYNKFSENKFKGEFVVVFEGKISDSEDSLIFESNDYNFKKDANLEQIIKLKSKSSSSTKDRGQSRNDRNSRDKRSKFGSSDGKQFRKSNSDAGFRGNRNRSSDSNESRGRKDYSSKKRDFQGNSLVKKRDSKNEQRINLKRK